MIRFQHLQCVAVAAGILGLALASPALAQRYPDKPVKLVFTFPAAGPVDNIAAPGAEDFRRPRSAGAHSRTGPARAAA